MTKKDYIAAVAEEANISKKDAREILAAAQTVAYKYMNEDVEGVRVFDGLILTKVKRDARVGRNPQTGESISIPARYAPKVRFGKTIKDAVN